MRLFVILICSMALVCLAPGAEAGKKKDKKSAHAGAVSKPAGQQKSKTAEWNKSKGTGKPNKANNWNNSQYSKKGKKWSNGNYANKPSGGQAYKAKWKTQTKHYNLSYRYNPKIQNAKFEKNYYIRGSESWNGERYAAFRSYHPEWHDQGWWRGRYNRVVFNSGGWYYWNAGWWYPAWGYAPNSYYAYNGPIYGYNGLSPDQVIANVQGALQQQGYYEGEADGLLGPQTRAALANYQRNHGLYMTLAIDRPTLESLGIT
jgi:hypothetical protein